MIKLRHLTMVFILFIFLAVILNTPASAFVVIAQINPAPESTSTPATDIGEPFEGNAPPPPSVASRMGFLSSYEFIITLIVAFVGVVALGMEFFLLRKTERPKSEDIMRIFGVTLIIIGTLFFVTAGYDSTQIAPAMGLFGTVAGYLLGRSTHRNDSSEE